MDAKRPRYRITTLEGRYRVEEWKGSLIRRDHGYWVPKDGPFTTEQTARQVQADLELMDRAWVPLTGEPQR